jgi:hypothetical protein
VGTQRKQKGRGDVFDVKELLDDLPPRRVEPIGVAVLFAAAEAREDAILVPVSPAALLLGHAPEFLDAGERDRTSYEEDSCARIVWKGRRRKRRCGEIHGRLRSTRTHRICCGLPSVRILDQFFRRKN